MLTDEMSREEAAVRASHDDEPARIDETWLDKVLLQGTEAVLDIDIAAPAQ